MRIALLAVAALSLATACAGVDEERPLVPDRTLPTMEIAPEVVPGEDWERIDPAEAGFTASALDELDRQMAAAGSSCLTIVRDGRLVRATTWAGGQAPRPVYSITKSMTALLVGIAVGDGDLELDEPVSDHVPAWRDGAAAGITVRHLLAMTSGRAYSDADDRAMIRTASDKTAYAIGLGQADPPGERWTYDNSAVQVLEQVLTAATGRDVIDLATDRLLEPLGMRETTWGRDRSGNALTYSGVASTCEDMARLGLLVQRGGRWGERQIVPEEFVREAAGRSSSRLNAGYGLLWWVNDSGTIIEARRQAGAPRDVPPRTGRLAPDAPDDTTWAFGYGFQYVMAVPSRDLVAVRLGPVPGDPTALTFGTFADRVLGTLD